VSRVSRVSLDGMDELFFSYLHFYLFFAVKRQIRDTLSVLVGEVGPADQAP
jgi:hypothetical protein